MGACIFDINTKKIKTFTIADGLLSNKINAISKTAENYICVVTFSGMSLFKIDDRTFHDYNFQSYDANFTTASILIDDKYYFGTQQGISSIETKSLEVLKYSNIPAKIRSIVVNGRMITGFNLDRHNELEFYAFDNNIRFDFSSTDLSPLVRSQFVYTLKGFDSEWMNSDCQNSIQYLDLKPYKYSFMVKDLSSPNSLHDEINFRIKPPRWRSPIMIFLYVVFDCGIVIVILMMVNMSTYKKLISFCVKYINLFLSVMKNY